MAFEDKTLTCVQCKSEFAFTAGEQEFFKERDLTSEPKRCKPCRQENKKSRKRGRGREQGQGEYRSPAFEGSAPSHQQIRGRGRGGRPGQAPRGRNDGDYRSPTFKDQRNDPQSEYRSPGFREQDSLNPDEEYRSPGFKEYEKINPDEEYRSPGFSDSTNSWKDEKPMFSINCVACGEEALVPFLPEEKEDPMCQECYREHKEQLKLEAEEIARDEAEEAEAAEAEAVEAKPTETEAVETEAVEAEPVEEATGSPSEELPEETPTE